MSQMTCVTTITKGRACEPLHNITKYISQISVYTKRRLGTIISVGGNAVNVFCSFRLRQAMH